MVFKKHFLFSKCFDAESVLHSWYYEERSITRIYFYSTADIFLLKNEVWGLDLKPD